MCKVCIDYHRVTTANNLLLEWAGGLQSVSIKPIDAECWGREGARKSTGYLRIPEHPDGYTRRVYVRLATM